jgi:hypothetical protein
MMFFEQVAQQLSGSVSPTVSNDGSAVSTVSASTASTLSSTTNTISKQPMYCDGSHLFYTIRKFPDLEMMVERTERPINCRHRTVAVGHQKGQGFEALSRHGDFEGADGSAGSSLF